MNTPDIIAAIEPVVAALEQLQVPYSVVGSVASSAHGIARATLDADLVADLRGVHVEPLVSALIDSYYIDKDAALDAVNRRSMFNVVHLATMLKVDVYVLTAREFDQESFRRRGRVALDESPGAREFCLDTAEDTVLHKLEWFQAGDEVARRQWQDAIGVLKVQGDVLDIEYMRRWAAEIGVGGLLERALVETGVSGKRED